MILVEAGMSDSRSFDGKTLFAQQLAARGHQVVLDAATLPDNANRTQRYDVASLLADPEGISVSQAILLGAEKVEETTLGRLRQHLSGTGASISAVGRFRSPQDVIGIRTRLAYLVGHEPDVVDLTDLQSGSSPVAGASPLAVSSRPAPHPAPDLPPHLFVFLPEEWVENRSILAVLAAMDGMARFRVSYIASGKARDAIRDTRFARLSVYGYSELPPGILAGLADVAAFFGDGVPGERMAAFAAELMGAGRPVIDGTENAGFQVCGAPVLRGPRELSALAAFVEGTVLSNYEAIGRNAQESPWVTSRRIEVLEAKLGLSVPRRPAVSADAVREAARVVFFPTNGHGLGHARRCSLVASELEHPDRAVFAAFPSCVPMLHSKGFATLPLVPKSDAHEDSFANDLITLRRLRRLVGPQDHLVFDGGYVFDSVFRTIKETRCSATWIRRGLFRPGQISSIQLDREQEFGAIIVPSECFDELNADYSYDPRVRRIGPVVEIRDPKDRNDTREELSSRFGVEFDTLVVTMLGSGAASDRTAQLQSLCTQLEIRPRLLHLIVLWPGATVDPSLYHRKASRIVRTMSSLKFCQAADFVVSAAGYNSFHELVYNGIPAIFLHQAASFLDDQERRARAAAERGLAQAVSPEEFLSLQRVVAEWLDTDRPDVIRKALAAESLPEPGTQTAARLVEGEVPL